MTVNPFFTANIIGMLPKIDKDLYRFSLDSLVDKIKQIEKKHPVFKKFNRHSKVFFFLILTWTS